MNKVTERLYGLFSPDRIIDYIAGKLLPDVLVAAAVLVAFYLLWRILQRTLGIVLKRLKLDETANRFIYTVTKYIVVIIGIVSALSQLGINTTSLLTSLGVAGLTIGFAAKDALSNVISGIFIFWDRPFVIGDLVEISGEYGNVVEITMRSTRVVTVDGKMLAIPNAQVVNTIVASYTNFPTLRIDIAATIGTKEDLNRVREVLLSILENDERFLQKPVPRVVVTALNDYNVAVELQVWIHEEREHIPIRFELREKAFSALREANVEMPFKTIAVESQELAAVLAANAKR